MHEYTHKNPSDSYWLFALFKFQTEFYPFPDAFSVKKEFEFDRVFWSCDQPAGAEIPFADQSTVYNVILRSFSLLKYFKIFTLCRKDHNFNHANFKMGFLEILVF